MFWFLFWLFNVIDKFAYKTGLWMGKDRTSQFNAYFESINVSSQLVPTIALHVVTLLELGALALLTLALAHFIAKNKKAAHALFFWGTFLGLVIFSLFTIGDQIFGDRFELLEHTIYWIALIVSWFVFDYYSKK